MNPDKRRRRLFRQSQEYAKEIYGYVLKMESDGISFQNIQFEKIKKTAKEIEELFYFKFPEIPFLKRMEAVAEYLIDEEETLQGKDMDLLKKEVFTEKLLRFYRT